MVQVGVMPLAIAFARNIAHAVGGGAVRGGHRVDRWNVEDRFRHAEGIYNILEPHIGEISGKRGLEIGPGPVFDVCELMLSRGARHMFAVEKFATESTHPGVTVLRQCIEEVHLQSSVDFAYSHDVLEHVRDVAATMRSVFGLLAPDGVFVSSVDLRAHNVFAVGGPLAHRTCPDWLYNLTTSHIETSNRVTLGELYDNALSAGFQANVRILARASREEVAAVRPHLTKRYEDLSDQDLSPLQVMLICKKPFV